MKILPSTRMLVFVPMILIASACLVISKSPELEAEELVQNAIIETEPPSVQSDLDTYSSDKYTFTYPNVYSITQPTTSFPVLTIEKAKNQRVEIFQMKDFGDRPWGFSGGESQEEIDGYVPKETYTVGSGDTQLNVWLFYNENDSQTQVELKAIMDSIVIK